MRIKAGDILRCIYFVAVDSVDLYSRLSSLSGVGVVYSIDGSNEAAMASPSPVHIGSGIFKLPIDESELVTLDSAIEEAELVLHITASEMAPVTRVLAIYNTPQVVIAENGLDQVSITEPAGNPATWNFRQKLLWLVARFFNKSQKDGLNNNVHVYNDAGVKLTSQTFTEDGQNEIIEKVTSP